MEIRWSDAQGVLEHHARALHALSAQSASAPFGDVEVVRAWSESGVASTAAVALDDGELCGLLLLVELPGSPGHFHLWGHTMDFGVVWAVPNREAECWHHWMHALRSRGAQSCVVRNLRIADPVTNAMLRACTRTGLDLELLDQRKAPFVDLRGRDEDWLGRRSASQRKQFRRARRKFQAIPDLDLRVATKDQDLGAALDTFFVLHHERRMALGLSSVYDNHEETLFLRSLVAMWAPKKRMVALVARSSDRLVGVELVLIDGHTWFSFNGGWSSDFASHHAGTGMLLWAMDEAREAGARRYSLLEGEEPYKLRMADGSHQLASWRLHFN